MLIETKPCKRPSHRKSPPRCTFMCALQQIGAMPMPFIHFLSGNFTIYTAHSPPSSVLASDELAARNPRLLSHSFSWSPHTAYHWFPSSPRRVTSPQGSHLAMFKLLVRVKGQQSTYTWLFISKPCFVLHFTFNIPSHLFSLNLVAFVAACHHSWVELEDCSSSKTSQLKERQVNDRVNANRHLAAPTCALRQIVS